MVFYYSAFWTEMMGYGTDGERSVMQSHLNAFVEI